METDNTLETLICQEIAANGPISFARFMELALYHPTLGYYSGGPDGREPVGWAGDYFTSVDLSPLWGHALARWLHAVWRALGEPARYEVIEPGAGRGLLAATVWEYALSEAPQWASALRYTLLDRVSAHSPLRHAREQALATRLAQIGVPADGVRWGEALPTGEMVGAVIANELADALPTHCVVKQGADLLELYVAIDERGRLIEQAGSASTSELANYLDRYRVPWRTYPDGWRAEVCLAAEAWMAEVARSLARGAALIIDYGETAQRLYTRDRRHGTLLAYRQHQLVERPLAQPGRQDLTAHVNFSALIASGRASGLRLAEYTTQAELLTRLGIWEETVAIAARLYPYAESERHTSRGQLDYLRRASLRNAVRELLNPHGLGGFRALVMHKGAPGLRKLASLQK